MLLGSAKDFMMSISLGGTTLDTLDGGCRDFDIERERGGRMSEKGQEEGGQGGEGKK